MQVTVIESENMNDNQDRDQMKMIELTLQNYDSLLVQFKHTLYCQYINPDKSFSLNKFKKSKQTK